VNGPQIWQISAYKFGLILLVKFNGKFFTELCGHAKFGGINPWGENCNEQKTTSELEEPYRSPFFFLFHSKNPTIFLFLPV
jgi:hypothetical protein